MILDAPKLRTEDEIARLIADIKGIVKVLDPVGYAWAEKEKAKRIIREVGEMFQDTPTLDILPGEGQKRITTEIRRRRECENCGEPAHFKHTFLLPNYRINPASKAYGRDDCSWCEDAAQFSCKNRKCYYEMSQMDGYEECSVFSAIERNSHMFLTWEEIKD
jgi:hypothetical protein